MNNLIQPHDIVTQARPPRRHHDIDAHMFAQRFTHLGGLKGQFPRRDEEQGLDFFEFRVDFFECGDDKGGGFAGAVFGAGEDVSACEGDGDAFFLDRGRVFVAGFENAHEQFAFEVEGFPFNTLCCSDVLDWYQYNVKQTVILLFLVGRPYLGPLDSSSSLRVGHFGRCETVSYAVLGQSEVPYVSALHLLR
jgi:hypothetical protein